ncbi:MAG: hypothetical protein RLZZ422_752 [Pseudomonadota bacterium]|jgi:very-short-patch-repair endonuclease
MPYIYLPPYDSPIEDIFAWNMSKYISTDATMSAQVPVSTIGGNFILDFVLEHPNLNKVVVECDGEEFHDIHKDEWRDAMILGSGYAEAIYRIRGSDINYHMNDVLFIMSHIHPEIISNRGSINLNVLATKQAKSLDISDRQDEYVLNYDEEEIKNSHLLLTVRRHRIPKGQRRYWKTAYDFAVSVGGGSLDELMKKKYALNSLDD